MEEHISVDDEIVKKIAVGIPLKGHTPPKSYNDRMMMAFVLGQKESEMRLQKISPRYEFYWFFVGEMFVPYAREFLADQALKYECDYLFMVDDDMLCPFDAFFKLLAHDRDMVSALAFMRNAPHYPVIYSLKEGWDSTAQSRYYMRNYVLNYPRNSLVQCDATGFGAVLIKTELFRKIPKPWFMSSDAIGEDILFCCKALENGFKIFCDTSVKTGHLSDSICVTEDYFDKHNKMTTEQWENQYGQYQRFETLEVAR